MNRFKRLLRCLVLKVYPELSVLEKNIDWSYLSNINTATNLEPHTKLFPPYHIYECQIGDYTYISYNAWISKTSIGKFCSIGPNLICGWGIHPTNGISTSPSFYSIKSPNNYSFSSDDKIEQREPITIGNDVFIGANVTILDGVTIGDGAIIGAGAVVSKDIPPYAIAVGCPIKINRYRFNKEQINALREIEWWNFDDDQIKDVEKYFYNIDSFIENHTKNV